MFRFRTISGRLVLAISVILALTCGILGEFSSMRQRSLARLALDQQLKPQFASVTAAIDYEGHAAQAIGGVVANLPPVAAALAAGDRDALVALPGAPAEALDAQGITCFGFLVAPAVNFLRVADPNNGVAYRFVQNRTPGGQGRERSPNIS